MDVFDLIRLANTLQASDVHLLADSPPLIRVWGALEAASGSLPLTASDIEIAFDQLITPEERQKFESELELDFGFTMPEVGRLRANASRQRGAITLAIRLLPPHIPSIEKLELPQICKDLVAKPRGLAIVTGPTGSGKSTTLAAMIDHLNHTESKRIVTIEDPIEYIHSSLKCAISQRQLGSDTLSFGHALKHVLRQNPDVIMVGEMRDLDTAMAVLTIAETGHLVLSTSHAPSAPQALERIIDLFPPHERRMAQTRLASLLVGVLCQTLVPRADSPGRIAAVEVMLSNAAIRNLIRDEKIYQLPNVMRTSRDEGMIIMDEALVELFRDKKITKATVFNYCQDSAEIKRMLTSGSSGKRRKQTEGVPPQPV